MVGTYTFLWVLFLVVLLVAIATLFVFLKRLTEEWAAPEELKLSKHWWRFIGPTAFAVFMASFSADIAMSNWVHLFYILILGIALPLSFAYCALKEVYQKKQLLILYTVSILLFINMAYFTTGWWFYFRGNHANEGGYYNPHTSKRNWLLIPLWILTILMLGYSAMMYRRDAKKNGQGLLPTSG